MIYCYVESPLGKILLCSDKKYLTALYLPEHKLYRADYTKTKCELFKQTSQQLHEYFAGKRQSFTLDIFLKGTDFQLKVFEALQTIKYGEVKTYKQLANSIKNPKAVRAVGLANSKNPVSIIVPCHRVIGSNGKLTGYAGGLKAKQWLINHEGR